jgi:hypothetical protein
MPPSKELTVQTEGELVQRREFIEVLSAAPPLPKSDAQIDAEREDSGCAPMGDTEVFRG